MAALIQFTGLFALRCGEACNLTAADLKLQAFPPQIRIRKSPGSGKSPGTIPITAEKVAYIRELQDRGISWKRKKKNRYGSWEVEDKFILPGQGVLFPSRKSNRKKKSLPITYHAVWSAINVLSKKFDRKYPGNDFEKIRSHSGRATAITTMMGQGVPLPLSMKFARHKPGSLRVHIAYGQLTCLDVYRALSGNGSKPPNDSLLPMRPGASDDPLGGVSLKNLVDWHKGGMLCKKEFQKAKEALLSRL